jgi:bla regulator protein BlaR1
MRPQRTPQARSLLLALALLSPAAISQPTAKKQINPAAKAIADAAKLPHYDVISIHVNKSGTDDSELDTLDNRFVAKNTSMRDIIQSAYNLDISDLISGLSGPAASAHFDIEAKILGQEGTPPKLSDDQLSAMVIPLLAERFHLKTHLEPKMLTVYELVVAKSGIKIKLKPTETDNGSMGFGADGDDNLMTVTQTSMSDLADFLSERVLHRIVTDRTGLTGAGDFRLKWSSDEAEMQGGATVSIFSAVEDQLGLKLQPSKALVDTLVIDHVEMPSEN